MKAFEFWEKCFESNGFTLFSCWQLRFHEKNCQKKFEQWYPERRKMTENLCIHKRHLALFRLKLKYSEVLIWIWIDFLLLAQTIIPWAKIWHMSQFGHLRFSTENSVVNPWATVQVNKWTPYASYSRNWTCCSLDLSPERHFWKNFGVFSISTGQSNM